MMRYFFWIFIIIFILGARVRIAIIRSIRKKDLDKNEFITNFKYLYEKKELDIFYYDNMTEFNNSDIDFIVTARNIMFPTFWLSKKILKNRTIIIDWPGLGLSDNGNCDFREKYQIIKHLIDELELKKGKRINFYVYLDGYDIISYALKDKCISKYIKEIHYINSFNSYKNKIDINIFKKLLLGVICNFNGTYSFFQFIRYKCVFKNEFNRNILLMKNDCLEYKINFFHNDNSLQNYTKIDILLEYKFHGNFTKIVSYIKSNLFSFISCIVTLFTVLASMISIIPDMITLKYYQIPFRNITMNLPILVTTLSLLIMLFCVIYLGNYTILKSFVNKTNKFRKIIKITILCILFLVSTFSLIDMGICKEFIILFSINYFIISASNSIVNFQFDLSYFRALKAEIAIFSYLISFIVSNLILFLNCFHLIQIFYKF